MAPGIGSLLVASLAVLLPIESAHLRPSRSHFPNSGRAHAVAFVQHRPSGNVHKDSKVDNVDMLDATTDPTTDVFNAEAAFDTEYPLQEVLRSNKTDMPHKVLDVVHHMQARNGHDISEIKEQFIGILDTALASLQNETAIEQSGVDALHHHIGECENAHNPSNVGIENRDMYQMQKSEHLQCRIDQGELTRNFEACDTNLALMQATMEAKCHVPALDEAVDTQSCLTKESSETKEHYFDRLRQHFADKASEYTSAKEECDTATTHVTAKSNECVRLQSNMEEKSSECNEKQMQVSSEACMWATVVETNCQALDECHSMAVSAWVEEMDRLDAVIEMREKSRKGMEFMKCVIGAVKADGDGVEDDIFDECKSNTFAEGTLSLTFPDHDVEVICSAPTIYPCSAEYLVDIQHGVPTNIQLSDCSDATCSTISTTTTTTVSFSSTTTTTTVTTTTLTNTVAIVPSGCSSSREDCGQAIDGDSATYSWITRSGADGPQLLTLNLPSEKEVVGVEITTSVMLGLHGSSECLKLGFEVGNERVTGVSTELPGAEVVPQSDVLHTTYDLTEFRPKSTDTSIWWSAVSGSEVKVTFNNCQVGSNTHWPIFEIKVIELEQR
jgi:hypothetical protein